MMRKRRERKRLRSESSAAETVTDCSGTIIRGSVLGKDWVAACLFVGLLN